MKRIILLLFLGLALTPWSAAAQVQVIANSSVPAESISAADLKEVFLGSKNVVGGTSVEPVLGGGAAHEAFLKEFVGKSDQALRNHFKSLVFTGKGSMPKSFPSDADVVKYVASTKGAIGYISAGAETAGVKKVQIK